MGTLHCRNANVGELVLAAFDDATLHSSDSREVSRLAAETIVDVLLREWTSMVQRAPSPSREKAGALYRSHNGTSTATRNSGQARIAAAWKLFLQRAERPAWSMAEAVQCGVAGGRADW